MNTTTNEVKFERNCFMFGEELTAVIGLPSKTLIYPSMEQHHSLCSDRNYWYRNCSSQRDYIIDLLEIFSSTEKCLLLSRHASIVLWFCSLSVLASNYIYIYTVCILYFVGNDLLTLKSCRYLGRSSDIYICTFATNIRSIFQDVDNSLKLADRFLQNIYAIYIQYIYIYMTLPLPLSYIYVLNEFLLFFSICWDSEIHCKNRHIIIDQFRWH